jgi:accessory gene regulator B
MSKIKFGLESLYLTLTKLIVISLISYFIGILKQMLIFTFLFSILRMLSFGLHAKKSWMCWISSTLIFIGVPYLCLLIEMPFIFKIIIGMIGTVLMFKNSPADTYKRPIVSIKRRLFFKISSTLLTIIYFILALIIDNSFIVNCLLFSIIVQNCLISPLVYKLFKLPYNNYKVFLQNNPNFRAS